MPLELTLNYSGMMEPVIGAHGLTEEDLKELLQALDSARTTVVERYKGGDLTWMGLPLTGEYATDVMDYWEERRSEIDAVVVLGIGGSALGSTALLTALRPPMWNSMPPESRDGARLYVADNADPEYLSWLMDLLPLEKTVFNVVTKSGSTAETLAQMLAVLPVLKESLAEDWKRHLVITTDPGKGAVRRFVKENDLASFPVPEGVGGRYSLLSPVGLFAAAGAGIDVNALLAGAREVFEHFVTAEEGACVPLLLAGLLHAADTRKGKNIHVMMPYCNRLKDVADWYRQLWAESLGKAVNRQGKKVNSGPTPAKALGTTDQHSQVQLYMEGPFDKVVMMVEVEEAPRDVEMGPQPLAEQAFTYLEGKSMWSLLRAEALGTRIALLKAGRCSMSLSIPAVNERTVGQLLYCWELAAAVAGELYDVNAFDQPGVEAGKIAAYALMGREGFEETAKDISALKSELESYTAP